VPDDPLGAGGHATSAVWAFFTQVTLSFPQPRISGVGKSRDLGRDMRGVSPFSVTSTTVSGRFNDLPKDAMSLSMNYYVVILRAQVSADSGGIGFSFQYEWRVLQGNPLHHGGCATVRFLSTSGPAGSGSV
jgi:hypothetical protein